jgi:hypothetical protein
VVRRAAGAAEPPFTEQNFVRRLVLAPGTHPRARDSFFARWLAELPARGKVRYARDLSRLHAALAADGRALPLGQPFVTPPPPPVDETAIAAARVRALFTA